VTFNNVICRVNLINEGVGVSEIFRPYTAQMVDPLVDHAITHLEEKIEKLKSLQGAEPEIATVIGRTGEVFGNLGVLWLVQHNGVLEATPLDLILRGNTDLVLRLLIQIEHGVYP
jgi:hypothetical protein